jgi:hypothetical protein
MSLLEKIGPAAAPGPGPAKPTPPALIMEVIETKDNAFTQIPQLKEFYGQVTKALKDQLNPIAKVMLQMNETYYHEFRDDMLGILPKPQGAPNQSTGSSGMKSTSDDEAPEESGSMETNKRKDSME